MTDEVRDIGSRSELDFDEVLWELELRGSDWVDAEFAAILIASGFGDRVICAAGPRPFEGFAQTATSRRGRSRREEDRRKPASRVRSPPRHQ